MLNSTRSARRSTCRPSRRAARRLRPAHLRPELPARPAARRGGREVRHRLLLRLHRRAEHGARRVGHARVQQHPHVPDRREVPPPDHRPDAADVFVRPGRPRPARETLVVWMGEFGRTPKINANISRDHWPQCYTALLAGGGVKRGFVYGACDKNAVYPARPGPAGRPGGDDVPPARHRPADGGLRAGNRPHLIAATWCRARLRDVAG